MTRITEFQTKITEIGNLDVNPRGQIKCPVDQDIRRRQIELNVADALYWSVDRHMIDLHWKSAGLDPEGTNKAQRAASRRVGTVRGQG